MFQTTPSVARNLWVNIDAPGVPRPLQHSRHIAKVLRNGGAARSLSLPLVDIVPQRKVQTVRRCTFESSLQSR